MNKPKSEWQTQELSRAYLEGVRGAMPGGDLQLVVMGKITQLWCASPSGILDLGCGDGIISRFLLDIFPEARGVFVDFSDPMLDAAREKVRGHSKASVVKADFATPLWLDAVMPSSPFDIVVSGFAIHHQPNERKKKLYSEIYDLLSPGGVFLNLEHVASSTPAGEKLFAEFFIDRLHAFHAKSNSDISREAVTDIYYKRPDKKENLLTPVEAQCRWLRDIGFEDVDCFLEVFELALFGGRKKKFSTPSSSRIISIWLSCLSRKTRL